MVNLFSIHCFVFKCLGTPVLQRVLHLLNTGTTGGKSSAWSSRLFEEAAFWIVPRWWLLFILSPGKCSKIFYIFDHKKRKRTRIFWDSFRVREPKYTQPVITKFYFKKHFVCIFSVVASIHALFYETITKVLNRDWMIESK